MMFAHLVKLAFIWPKIAPVYHVILDVVIAQDQAFAQVVRQIGT